MKRVILALVAIPLICTVSFAGDYIKLGVDAVPAGAASFEIPFLIERTCPTPAMICGISNGFVFVATGGATWAWQGYVRDSVASSWFTLGGLLFTTSGMDGTSPDSLLTGGACMCCGFPVVDERPFFSIFLDIGVGEGEILVDSAFVMGAGAWKWSGLSCAPGAGAPDRPFFLDKDGNDWYHPIPITVFTPICGDVTLDGVVDIDDAVFVVEYVFNFGPAPNPLSVADCNCSDGDVPVDIDDIVHLMDYILRGGPEPCDTDGDGVPDC